MGARRKNTHHPPVSTLPSRMAAGRKVQNTNTPLAKYQKSYDRVLESCLRGLTTLFPRLPPPPPQPTRTSSVSRTLTKATTKIPLLGLSEGHPRPDQQGVRAPCSFRAAAASHFHDIKVSLPPSNPPNISRPNHLRHPASASCFVDPPLLKQPLPPLPRKITDEMYMNDPLIPRAIHPSSRLGDFYNDRRLVELVDRRRAGECPLKRVRQHNLDDFLVLLGREEALLWLLKWCCCRCPRCCRAQGGSEGYRCGLGHSEAQHGLWWLVVPGACGRRCVLQTVSVAWVRCFKLVWSCNKSNTSATR